MNDPARAMSGASPRKRPCRASCVALSRLASLILTLTLLPAAALAQTGPAQPVPADVANPATAEPSQSPTRGPRPFGANLFAGTYAAQRANGINPTYRILPGDRVMVNAWGAVQVNDVFVVDTQGNIFIPTVGPIPLAGVENASLTNTLEGAIRRVYRGSFGVYTNLLTASPVAVFVTGGVPRPGRYAGIPSDSVLFFLDQAGGINPDTGSYRTLRVMRQGNEVAVIDLYEFLLNGTMATPQFEDGDTILVGRRGPSVEVHRPDQSDVLVELRASDDGTLRGDGLLEVVAGGARVTAVTLRGMRDERSVAQTLSLEELGEAELRDGDRLFFREDVSPDFIVVHLEGEYRGPSQLAVRRGTRLLDLLNFVPVRRDLSRTDAVHIRRRQIRTQQQAALQESLNRLERATVLALSDTNNEAQIRVREAELVRGFVERARNVEPLGLMVTSTAEHQLNVLLQDGDVVVIPAATNVIHVVGEVQIPHAVMYRPDLTVMDYVQMAGGFSNRADRDHVLIRRANASIVVGDMNTPVRPGDQVMIPPSVDDKWLQNGIDIAQVIYQIAIAASVVLRPL
ncbi:MAG: SLBB domain-containing protein [Sandaracinaceae bacterium]